MPDWLKTISRLNPLTYVVDALRTFMLAGSTSTFGQDYAVIFLTTTVLVFIGARLYPRLADVTLLTVPNKDKSTLIPARRRAHGAPIILVPGTTCSTWI